MRALERDCSNLLDLLDCCYIASYTCCGVVPGTSFEMLSQTLGREEWNSEDEFMNVLSIRSSATERDAGTAPLPPALLPRE